MSIRVRSPLDLTLREVEVLRAIAPGLTNGEIANRDHFAVETVKFHLGNIFRKLGVTNRTEAVWRGLELGLIEPPVPLDAEVNGCPHCGKAYV